MNKRPKVMEKKHLDYLDKLRDANVTDMFLAYIFIERIFTVTMDEAKEILNYWLDAPVAKHTV